MKKALSVTVFLALFTFLFPVVLNSQAYAYPASAVEDKTQYENALKQDKSSLEQFSAVNFHSLLNAALMETAGCITDCSNSQYATQGAIGGVASMIAQTFENKPADTQTYVASLLQDMNIAQPAYAQGLGFSALEPILNIWKTFRDIAYVFFVFLFLIIGFAIMFRKSLGGQTAVTVQQALPRIIVALLAVSFSYAIAGLLIDFMWIVMYFLITIFSSAHLIDPKVLGNSSDSYAILNFNIFEVFGRVIASGYANNAGEAVGRFVNDALGVAKGEGLFKAAGEVITWVVGVLAMLVIFVAILFAMFRTFFALIKVYFEIILMIIFAPIILMMGAINGNTFGNWIKGLVANLAVFPVLLVFIIVGFMLTSLSSSSGKLSSANSFVPPFVPGSSGSNRAATIGYIGGIAAIMLLPEVVTIVGKFKPASLFDEFAPKIFDQAKTANRFAMPAAGLVLGGPANVATQGAKQAWANIKNVAPGDATRPVTFRDYAVNAGRGFKAAFNRDNFKAGAGAGYKAGGNLVRQQENLLEGRLKDANNFEKFIMDRTDKKTQEEAAAAKAKKDAEENEPAA